MIERFGTDGVGYRLPDLDSAAFPPEASAIRARAQAVGEELRAAAEAMDLSNSFSPMVYERLAQEGYLAMLSSSDPNPLLRSAAYVIVTEELGRVSAALANLVQLTTVAAYFLDRYGTGAELSTADIRSGTTSCAIGMTEPQAGSDVANIRTLAERAGDGYILNGLKTFVTAARLSRFAIITAKTGRREELGQVSTFLVDLHSEGVDLGAADDFLGSRGLGTATIHFRNVRLPPNACLGQEGKGLRQILSVIDIGRLGIAGLALGLASASLEAAAKESAGRHSFGKPIANHQGVQFRLAELYAQVASARTLLHNAALLQAAGRPFSLQAATAKFLTSEIALRCATDAIQLHGGDGYRRGSTVERLFRDAKGTQIYEGANEIQRVILARSLLKDLL